ncbi:MAG: TlpA family protein disulfide reductase [Bacteroidales bacterium]|nr:TlpA family protein disulfide reductase [Bacteroidales bacterium]
MRFKSIIAMAACVVLAACTSQAGAGNQTGIKAFLSSIFSRQEQAKPAKGVPFTDLVLFDTESEYHHLSDYLGKGNWVLVDFWASWCGPCRAEMPNVVAAYKKYHDKGFDIVGISLDKNQGAWVKAIADLDMPWHHLSDLQGWNSIAAAVYGIDAIPASLLVNPDGEIVARDLRGSALGNKLATIYGE